MADDPEGIETFDALGVKYTVVFGMKAIKATETYFGDDSGPKPFFLAIQSAMPKLDPKDLGDKAKIAEASMGIRFTDVCTLFGFSLLKHHPGLTEDEIDDLIDEIGLTKASEMLGKTIGAALVKEGDNGSSKNPPKARRAR